MYTYNSTSFCYFSHKHLVSFAIVTVTMVTTYIVRNFKSTKKYMDATV